MQRPESRGPRVRPGFTMIEMLVSMVILVTVLGLGSQLVRRQARVLSMQAGRQEAQTTADFALATLERELRMAGAGVVDAQPMLVEGDRLTVTFNVDLVSRRKGDVGAVYVDPDADSAAAGVMRREEATALPATGRSYPDSTYMQAPGVPSGAETICFWLTPDSTSGRANEYLLMRRVNATPPQVVARGIVVDATDTVFTFLGPGGQPIRASALPLHHAVALHGSPADTGRAAVIDSVRSVRVRLTTVYHDARRGDVTRPRVLTIRILNAGLGRRTSCGEPPLGVTPSATPSLPGSATPSVTIGWSKSVDDGTGEKDVERYVLFRSRTGGAFGEPFASVPAGAAGSTYTYTDTDVKPGDGWVYGVAAQDCTPSSSPVATTARVVVP